MQDLSSAPALHSNCLPPLLSKPAHTFATPQSQAVQDAPSLTYAWSWHLTCASSGRWSTRNLFSTACTRAGTERGAQSASLLEQTYRTRHRDLHQPSSKTTMQQGCCVCVARVGPAAGVDRWHASHPEPPARAALPQVVHQPPAQRGSTQQQRQDQASAGHASATRTARQSDGARAALARRCSTAGTQQLAVCLRQASGKRRLKSRPRLRISVPFFTSHSQVLLHHIVQRHAALEAGGQQRPR